jgi:hypothetical protein
MCVFVCLKSLQAFYYAFIFTMSFNAKGNVFSVENRFRIHAGGSVGLGSIVELRIQKPVDPLFWLIWTTAFWLIAGAPDL